MLIKDTSATDDKLGTLVDYGIPNLRRTWSPYNVYGMGQPSKDGLLTFINSLKTKQYEVFRHVCQVVNSHVALCGHGQAFH